MYAVQLAIFIGEVEATEDAISFCFLHLVLFSSLWTFVWLNSAIVIDVGDYMYKDWETEWEQLPGMEVQQKAWGWYSCSIIGNYAWLYLQ